MILDINSHKFKVKVVSSKFDVQKGMMKQRFNENFNGMLFMMGSGKHSFWMKDCIIPLDIIFIDNNEITNIYSDCQPCFTDNCKSYTGFGNLVLEVEGGTCDMLEISEGDFIKFDW
jgi:uncharacterized membrane protein (UPF0127 family)